MVHYLFVFACTILNLFLPTLSVAGEIFTADQGTLRYLETNAHSIGQSLCDRNSVNNQALARNCKVYRDLVGTVSDDIVEAYDRNQQYLEKGYVEYFEPGLLVSERTAFKLIGVVERFDRSMQLPNSCGEIRLVYRMVVEFEDAGEWYKSYMPMSLMVVYELSKKQNCAEILSSTRQLPWANRLDLYDNLVRKTRIETNILGVHIPAPFLINSAGRAEYLLRVHELDKSTEQITPLKLENTPDVETIVSDKSKHKKFLNWLFDRVRLQDLDRGNLIIPDEFLAEKAVSVSPFGLLRTENNPFALLINEESVKIIDLVEFPTIDQRAKLIRRLNGLACVGCHQTHSDAGFHFFGANLQESYSFNRTRFVASNHFFSLQDWRQSAFANIQQSVAINELPVPGRHPNDPGREGDFCYHGDRNKSAYACRSDLYCADYWDNSTDNDLLMGRCEKLPVNLIGKSCLFGTWEEYISSGFSFLLSDNCQNNALCLPQSIGFPGGMCTHSCFEDESVGCASVPDLLRFANCLNDEKGIRYCYENASKETSLRSCSLDSPCRPDYLCVESGEKKGLCVPPYFLIQMNLRFFREI